MKSYLALALALLSAPLLHADLVITMKEERGGGVENSVIKTGKSGFRLEGETGVMIFRTTPPELILLDTVEKTGLRMAGSQEEPTVTLEVAPSTGNPPKALGKTEEISGIKTELYTASTTSDTGETTESTFWIATDHPLKDEYFAFIALIEKSGADQTKGEVRLSALPGIPIKTVEKSTDGTVTSTIVSIEKKDLPESDFNVPEGYKVQDFDAGP